MQRKSHDLNLNDNNRDVYINLSSTYITPDICFINKLTCQHAKTDVDMRVYYVNM